MLFTLFYTFFKYIFLRFLKLSGCVLGYGNESKDLFIYPPFCEGVVDTRYIVHISLTVKLVHYRGENSLLGTKGAE